MKETSFTKIKQNDWKKGNSVKESRGQPKSGALIQAASKWQLFIGINLDNA